MYTLSVLVTGFVRGDTGTDVSLNINSGSSIKKKIVLDGVGLYSATTTLDDGVCDNVRGVLPRNGAAVTIAAVKLERGNSQTLAHQDAQGNWVINDIPDKAQELWKCQRYYQLFSSADKRPTDKRDFRPELVSNATDVGEVVIDGTTYYYADTNLSKG